MYAERDGSRRTNHETRFQKDQSVHDETPVISCVKRHVLSVARHIFGVCFWSMFETTELALMAFYVNLNLVKCKQNVLV